jgi:hypothetical protein
MVLQPGDSTRVDMQFMMHEGMDGKHDFRVHIPSNDPQQKDKTVEILSDWGP